MKYQEWQYGKQYKIAQDGDVMVRRERGVRLGDVRVFLHSRKLAYDTEVLYYAERDIRSIIPFKAPVVWWRKISD